MGEPRGFTFPDAQGLHGLLRRQMYQKRKDYLVAKLTPGPCGETDISLKPRYALVPNLFMWGLLLGVIITSHYTYVCMYVM